MMGFKEEAHTQHTEPQMHRIYAAAGQTEIPTNIIATDANYGQLLAKATRMNENLDQVNNKPAGTTHYFVDFD